MTQLSERAKARIQEAEATQPAPGQAPDPAATKTPERREPLSAIEASLVSTVGQWREEQCQRLEVEWQRVLQQSNERIAPVLKAHRMKKGEEWQIVDDETVPTGLALVITPGTGDTEAGTKTVPITAPVTRQAIRQAQRQTNKAIRGGRR